MLSRPTTLDAPVTSSRCRLVSLYVCLRDVHGFSFAMMAPAFKVNGEEAVTAFARWCYQFVEEMKIDDLIPDEAQQTTEDDASGSDTESEDAAAASEGDAEETKALEKSNVPSRYLASVIDKDLESFCLGMAVHPPTLGDERAHQDRALELEQLMLNQTVEHVRKTFTDYYGYANVYFVSRATSCILRRTSRPRRRPTLDFCFRRSGCTLRKAWRINGTAVTICSSRIRTCCDSSSSTRRAACERRALSHGLRMSSAA